MNKENYIVGTVINRRILRDVLDIKIVEDECSNSYKLLIVIPEYLEN